MSAPENLSPVSEESLRAKMSSRQSSPPAGHVAGETPEIIASPELAKPEVSPKKVVDPEFDAVKVELPVGEHARIIEKASEMKAPAVPSIPVKEFVERRASYDAEEKKVECDEEEAKIAGAAPEMLVRQPTAGPESTFVYTPICVRDPRKFKEKGYELQFSGIRIFTVITMYNENYEEVITTLRGVCENLRNFTDKSGDPDFWKQVAVVIVSDGREKANQKTLDFLSDMGIFDENLVADSINKYGSEKIGCHLFESTLVFADNPVLETEFPPLQTMFALKEHNGGKIDSHWWYFEAFANYFQPEYCFLLDVGTKPRRKAFYHLYRAMERNKQIAGACGEITTRSKVNSNFIVAGQHFEYKIAGLLDKAMESVFGYISVLPGAFSTYRYSALVGQPLRKYFHHIEHRGATMTPFEANMYLAEDRILCFELFAKKENAHTLHFVSDSVAETDVPDSIVGLLKQRRRWLNGSFFASLYAVLNFQRILTDSTHSAMRKAAVSFLFMYYFLQLFVTLILVGAFYLTVAFTLTLVFGSLDHPAAFVLNTIFMLSLIAQFLFALGDKPNNLEPAYNVLYVTQGLYFLTIVGFIPYYTLITIIRGNVVMLIGFLLSLVIYFIVTLMYGEFMSICTSFVQYLFVTPSFMVMFPIYSFCNVHDVSWGTKDLDSNPTKGTVKDAQALKDEVERKRKAAAEKAKIEASFSRFRMKMVVTWGLLNFIMVRAVGAFNVANEFLLVMLYGIIFLNGIKFLGTIVYKIVTAFTRWQERIENSNSSKGKILKRRSIFQILRDILCVPLYLKTWVGIFCVIVLSPALMLLEFVWVFVTGMLAIPISFFTFGNSINTQIITSWRYLANIEFDLLSNDGSVAKYLSIDASSLRHTVRVCPPAALDEEEKSKPLMNTPANWKPLVYFLIAKPVFTMMSLFAVAISLYLPFLFFFADFFISMCKDESTSSFVCNYSNALYNNSLWASLVKSYLHLVIGFALLWILFLMIQRLYKTLRILISNILGEAYVPLELKFSIRTNSVHDSVDADLRDLEAAVTDGAPMGEPVGKLLLPSGLSGRALTKAELNEIKDASSMTDASHTEHVKKGIAVSRHLRGPSEFQRKHMEVIMRDMASEESPQSKSRDDEHDRPLSAARSGSFDLRVLKMTARSSGSLKDLPSGRRLSGHLSGKVATPTMDSSIHGLKSKMSGPGSEPENAREALMGSFVRRPSSVRQSSVDSKGSKGDKMV